MTNRPSAWHRRKSSISPSCLDATNALITLSLTYAIVARLANDKPDNAFILKKILISPPLWALILAIICKAAGLTPPDVFMDALATIAKLVGPVILIALGFNSITFAELEGLDTEFAASQVSIALLLALFIAPFTIHFLPRL